VTSIAEVVAPGIDDLLIGLVNYRLDLAKLLAAQLVIVGKFDFRLQPEFGLAVAAKGMNRDPRFLPRKKKRRYPFLRSTVGLTWPPTLVAE
jgi:hypothetical protein